MNKTRSEPSTPARSYEVVTSNSAGSLRSDTPKRTRRLIHLPPYELPEVTARLSLHQTPRSVKTKRRLSSQKTPSQPSQKLRNSFTTRRRSSMILASNGELGFDSNYVGPITIDYLRFFCKVSVKQEKAKEEGRGRISPNIHSGQNAAVHQNEENQLRLDHDYEGELQIQNFDRSLPIPDTGKLMQSPFQLYGDYMYHDKKTITLETLGAPFQPVANLDVRQDSDVPENQDVPYTATEAPKISRLGVVPDEYQSTPKILSPPPKTFSYLEKILHARRLKNQQRQSEEISKRALETPNNERKVEASDSTYKLIIEDHMSQFNSVDQGELYAESDARNKLLASESSLHHSVGDTPNGSGGVVISGNITPDNLPGPSAEHFKDDSESMEVADLSQLHIKQIDNSEEFEASTNQVPVLEEGSNSGDFSVDIEGDHVGDRSLTKETLQENGESVNALELTTDMESSRTLLNLQNLDLQQEEIQELSFQYEPEDQTPPGTPQYSSSPGVIQEEYTLDQDSPDLQIQPDFIHLDSPPNSRPPPVIRVPHITTHNLSVHSTTTLPMNTVKNLVKQIRHYDAMDQPRKRQRTMATSLYTDIQVKSNEFLGNVIRDLQAYAHHRKSSQINISDVLLFLNRIKFGDNNVETISKLAQNFLPLELLISLDGALNSQQVPQSDSDDEESSSVSINSD